MTALSLDEAPAQLKEDAREFWLHGEASDPECGDLWLLSWNGEALSLAVVGSVYPGFVRAWPVTIQPPALSDVAVELPCQLFNSPLTLWPHMETGLGMHLLDRKIDHVLSSRQVGLLRRFAFENDPPPLPLIQGSAKGVTTADKDGIIRMFGQLCFIEWPENRLGEAILAREVLAAKGRTAEDVATALGLETAEAFAIWTGQKAVDALSAQRLCSLLELPLEEVLKAPNGPEVRELQRPEHKMALSQLAKLRGTTESQSRNAAREEFTLAARSTGSSRALSSKVRSAIERLLEDQ
ncbi:hypothetical protein ACFRAU_11560 [Arthrobacter sp. NPDC056691]|uniref:hypothetical protein n=1 Tax=Arthrobacter sp. NPDC056691 TaxID=3345913 RepID=UPI0036717B10